MKTTVRAEISLFSRKKRKQKTSKCYIYHTKSPGGYTHNLTALADFSRKKQKAKILSITTKWQIDRWMLFFQKALKKGEIVNAFAFLYCCLKDIEETLIFLLGYFYQVFFPVVLDPWKLLLKSRWQFHILEGIRTCYHTFENISTCILLNIK